MYSKPVLTPRDWIVRVVMDDDSVRRIGVDPEVDKDKAVETAVAMIGPVKAHMIKDIEVNRRNGLDSSRYTPRR